MGLSDRKVEFSWMLGDNSKSTIEPVSQRGSFPSWGSSRRDLTAICQELFGFGFLAMNRFRLSRDFILLANHRNQSSCILLFSYICF